MNKENNSDAWNITTRFNMLFYWVILQLFKVWFVKKKVCSISIIWWLFFTCVLFNFCVMKKVLVFFCASFLSKLIRKWKDCWDLNNNNYNCSNYLAFFSLVWLFFFELTNHLQFWILCFYCNLISDDGGMSTEALFLENNRINC